MKLQSRILSGPDTQDTKLTAVLATLGWELTGAFVTLDKNHPQSSGGVANWCLSPKDTVPQATWEFAHGTGDDHLQNTLSRYHEEGILNDAQLAELEEVQRNALICFGRKMLANYSFLVRTAKEKCYRFVIQGGEEVPVDLTDVPEKFHECAPKLKQGFTVTQLAPAGKAKSKK